MTELISHTETAPDARSVTELFTTVQMELLAAGDTVGLAARYAEDAVFARFDRVATGRAEIQALFDDYLVENPTLTGLDVIRITDDVILYQAPEYLSGRLTTAVGTIAFRDGLVWRQTVAFVACRPEDILTGRTPA